MAWEHAVDIANTLNAHMWINIPHKATDDYIDSLATYILNNLNSNLNVYVEYSNEIWNTIFDQRAFVNNNAPGHQNAYVSTDLAAISSPNIWKKMAYMSKRVFDRFYTVWSGSTDRLIRVIATQTALAFGTDQQLDYLYDTLSGAADALAITGYLSSIQQEQHDIWNADPGSVTAQDVLDYITGLLAGREHTWADNQKAEADKRSLPIIVYEGGPGFPAYSSQSWDYNQAVYDAHIDPDIYDLYQMNFRKYADSSINCQLFMAFVLSGRREQTGGSWGHLENMGDYDDPDLINVSPKYKALVDINIQR
jgi:hypothetical protein